MERVLCVILCIFAIVVTACAIACSAEQATEIMPEETTVATEPTEPTEPAETEAPTEEPTEIIPAIPLYDVPLDAELQLHIIHTAEEKQIDPAIVVAMAFRESTYNPNLIGDGGDSYGLLQVQPKWHYERMQKLGCTDLLDPFQNVTVAVDYLAEQIERYGGDVAKGLTAYNRGHYTGTITQYAKSVMAKADELKGETQ